MLRPSGTVEGKLANPARAGRQQRQSVFLCRGSLAYFTETMPVSFLGLLDDAPGSPSSLLK
jgi:hypothetical protein